LVGKVKNHDRERICNTHGKHEIYTLWLEMLKEEITSDLGTDGRIILI
jgi:hypothetical protein